MGLLREEPHGFPSSNLADYCVVVAGGVVAGGVVGAGVAGCSVVVAGAAGCSVVAGAMASCGALPPNHPLAQPMIASTMTTTTTPMIVFFLSMLTSLALN
jgi:hypothetical protein